MKRQAPYCKHGDCGPVLSVTVTAIFILMATMTASTVVGTVPSVNRTLRVLAIETAAAKSHWNFMRGVLLALADRGHQVTVYTPFPRHHTSTAADDHYVEIDTSAAYSENLTIVGMDYETVLSTFSRPSFMVSFITEADRFSCDLIDKLASRHVSGTFDVFVTEQMSSECISYAAHLLGVPLIYTVPSPLLPWIETAAFGHYPNPAYASHLMSAYAVPDSMYRRLHNVALHLYTVCLYYWHATKATFTGNRPYDSVQPVKPSLVFVNTHYITEPPRPVTLNRVDVGGIHLVPPEPLPVDILEFIEDSPHGVIYLTLGTVITLSTLPDHIQKAFRDALAEVPQRVLLKYEGEMKDKPANVMTSKWLPQRDILLHPKVKLFIGHGGISGVYEAVDAGIPFIGFPLFFDQSRNVANLVEAGMAISLDLTSITKSQLLSAIIEIVNNEKYSKNAKLVSERFKDRPMSPAESVVYWTEYIVRHKGAPHLKSYALNLTWYQYFLLDVIATVLLIIYAIYRGFKFIKKCAFNSYVKCKTKSD